jgi:hypothetical protein
MARWKYSSRFLSFTYYICQEPEKTFLQYAKIDFVVPFRRRFTPGLVSQWGCIMNKVISMSLSCEEDSVSWLLHKNGRFTTKSLYQHLQKGLFVPNF